MTSETRWYSVNEIAELAGVAPFTARKWLREGRMATRKYGGQTGYRVRDDELQRFLGEFDRSARHLAELDRPAKNSDGESHQAMIHVTVGNNLMFLAKFEEEAAPKTCAEFRKLLPYRQKLIQARWSGEAAWIPLGELKLDVPWENATSYPGAGEILFYPGGYSETEILFPYGRTCFASTLGQLAGNHFLTIVEGAEQLKEVGRRVLWDGALDVVFERIDE